MFRKNKGEDGLPAEPGEPLPGDPADLAAPPLKPFSRRGSHAPAKMPATTFPAEAQRRAQPALPTIPRRTAERTARPTDTDSKRLFVGREICLSGEITSCDKLVVEGRVEASLSSARVIEIAPTGFFRGSAQVEEADISGRYEGELIATDKLIVRAGGQLSGSIRYGRIVIESGGQISGDMQNLEQARPQPATIPAAPSPVSDPD